MINSAFELRATTSTSNALEITPFVDGISLIDLVADFEASRGYESAGGYAGIIPAHFRFGDLRDYYFGRERRQWPESGRLWLLGCDCGEVGCWPLEVGVAFTDDIVVWSDFRQPHREKRSYDSFGPFQFDRRSYDDQIANVLGQLRNSDRAE